jgi:hypothetical protein
VGGSERGDAERGAPRAPPRRARDLRARPRETSEGPSSTRLAEHEVCTRAWEGSRSPVFCGRASASRALGAAVAAYKSPLKVPWQTVGSLEQMVPEAAAGATTQARRQSRH